MRTTHKKIASLFLAATFLATIIPFSRINTFAATATKQTLSDGSEWSTELGSAATFDVDSAGGYTVSTTEYSSDNGMFKIMTDKEYPLLGSSFAISCPYADKAPSFGFCENASLDSIQNNVANEYGRIEFYRIETGNNTRLQLVINGTPADVAQFAATRGALFNIQIVKSGESYYLKYGYWIIDGEHWGTYSDEVKQALKLENYFPKDFLENGGMAHFFFSANQMYAGSTRCIVRQNQGESYASTTSHVYNGDYDIGSSSAWIIPSDDAKVTYDAADGDWKGTYTFSAGKGGTSASFGLPVTKVDNGSTQSEQFATIIRFDGAPNDVATTYVDFSNDPTFKEGSYNTVNMYYIPSSGTVAHIKYNETIGMPNILCGAGYNWTFLSDGNTITGLDIHSGANGGTFSAAFDKLEVGKPIFMKIRKDYNPSVSASTTYQVYIKDSNNINATSELEQTISSIDDITSENINEVKNTLDGFYQSDLRCAVSYEVQAKASDLMLKYNYLLNCSADSLNARINALPPIEQVLWQDKAEIESIRSEYNSLPDIVQSKISISALEPYEAVAESLTDDGRYRAAEGFVYCVNCNRNSIELGGDKNNGALTVKTIANQNNEESYLSVITDNSYPIVSGKYEFQSNFGTTGSSVSFGFVTDNGSDEFSNVTNFFKIFRMESGNTNTFYITVNSVAQECASISYTTRARVWLIGVAKKDGSHYITIDGKIIDGEGYSDDVRNALKLENHFNPGFLDDNSMVHFFFNAASMNGNAYLRPLVELKNGLITEAKDNFIDENGCSGWIPSAVASYNVINSDIKVNSDGNTVYSCNLPENNDSAPYNKVTIASPISKENGFELCGSMPIDTNPAHQWVEYSFSNDPTFNDPNKVSFNIVQIANSRACHIIGAKNSITNMSDLYSGNLSFNCSFVKQEDNSYVLHIVGGSNQCDVQNDGWVELMNGPIYLRINSNSTNAKLNMIVVNHDNGTGYNFVNEESFDLPEAATDLENTENSLDAFYSDANRYNSSASLEKATILRVLCEDKNKQIVTDSGFAKCISDLEADSVNWVYNKDGIQTVANKYNSFTSRQKAYADVDSLNQMQNYIAGLKDANAVNLVELRTMILGVKDNDTIAYDYYHDGTLSIHDLVRMKKISAGFSK